MSVGMCVGLSVLILSVTCCNGQGKSSPPRTQAKSAPKGQRSVSPSYPKIRRSRGIPSGNIGCELQDKDGNLWFSAGGEGVFRYDGKSFINFTEKDGLCGSAGKVIQSRSGKIFIATDKGVCIYDGKTFRSYFQSDSLKQLHITSLYEDRKGNLWFGAMGKGVYRFDGKKLANFLNGGKFNLGRRYQLIQDILEDAKGNLWFTSWNGGGAWRYDGNTFTNFVPPAIYYTTNEDGRSANKPQQLTTFFQQYNPPQVTDSITDDMIFSVSEDKAGNIWFATRRHGACRFDGKKFTSFREQEGFVNYGIYSILEDRKGNFWFTTDKNGVWRYDGKSFRNFTTKDGLVHNSVFSVLEDASANIWFGTRGFGLSRYDGKGFVTFSE